MTSEYRINEVVLRNILLKAIFEDCEPGLPGSARFSKGLLFEQFAGTILRVRYRLKY